MRKEVYANREAMITIQGPVDIPDAVQEIKTPISPASILTNTLINTILARLFVQKFAAAGGVMSMEEMSTMPTERIPITIARIVKLVSTSSRYFTG